MRTLMKTINFGKNLRLFQIQPIKTAEIKSIKFGKKKGKTLQPVCENVNNYLDSLSIERVLHSFLFQVRDMTNAANGLRKATK
jgi:hypothetical protein